MDRPYPNGYLELKIGPMFSGKTSWLIDVYSQFTYCETKVVVINHVTDVRYDTAMLSTHDKKMIPCIQMSSFDAANIDAKVMDTILDADVVLINEGQFFDNIVPFVKDLIGHNKMIYICGLDGDFQQHRFGDLIDLIPICDKVTKLHSLCGRCKNGTPAIFSHRLDDKTEQRVIGSSNYTPLCRKCFKQCTTTTTI